MSIPLDHLYHYIENIAKEVRGDDVIIYRFYPHGSKKIDNLLLLNEKLAKLDYVERMTVMSMICHDQEPLDYQAYSKQDFWEIFKRNNQNNLLSEENIPGIKDLVTGMHLRSVFRNPFNCYDKTLLCHSEKNSKNLEDYENNGFIGVYWWSHAVIAQDWFRYAKHDPLLEFDTETINKDFLIYNRAWTGTREYRLTFVELLANHDLVDSCNIKFSPEDDGNHYTNHIFKNSNLAISRQDLDKIYPRNYSSSSASADYVSTDYAESGIEIVLETLFDDSRLHLTEKSLRPIACGHPFILCATTNSLKYLQSYGFKTFDGLIDESYDTIVDPKQRLEAIVREMKRIANLDIESKKVLWAKLNEISKQNQIRFFSSEWHNSIIKEYATNFDSAIAHLKHHANGKFWHELNDLGKVSDEFVKSMNSNTPFRTTQQREQLLKWLENQNKY
jgi:hypothetical protein